MNIIIILLLLLLLSKLDSIDTEHSNKRVGAKPHSTYLTSV